MPKPNRPTIPDTFHHHEALHMASVIMDLVERELIEAEAIKANGDWSARAADIHQRLFDLYQAIGAVHLDGDEDLVKAPRPTNTKRPGR